MNTAHIQVRVIGALSSLLVAVHHLPADAQQPAAEAQSVLSSDVRGAGDHPTIGRYEGSVILAQTHKAFDEVVLPNAPAEGKLYQPKEQKLRSAIQARGEVTRSIYVAPQGRSSLEVTRNFVDALSAKGFKPAYECAGATCGESFPMLVYNKQRPETLLVGEGYEQPRLHLLDNVFAARFVGANVSQNLSDLRYSLFKKSDASGDSYVALYAAKHGKGLNVYGNALSDRVAVLASVVEPRAMESRMVVVDAKKIGSQIASEGRAVFYGILFDFDKADIKPESESQLEELAKFLQQNPSSRVFIVGHTDNKGTLDYNLGLSGRRAESVVNALTGKHRIDGKRLLARGLGPLAPVASNRTEDGRAKNRRVELVEQ
jgi:OmpA-OmpF porin, OOP family